MSAVRYKKQLAQLELDLEARLARLRLLEAENSALKQKERALQSCISGLESGLSASKSVLRSSSLRSNSLTANNTSLTGSLPSPETLAGSAPKTLDLSWSPSTLQTLSNSSCSDNDAAATYDSASSSSPLLTHQQAQSSAVLAALDAKEQQIQQIINQLGCGSSFTELYSSKLLEKATSDPARAAAFVSLDRQSRLKYLIQAIQRMALLLPKYGTSAPATSTGSAQQQLDSLIDEVSEIVLTCGLLDPPNLKLDWLMTHLETLQYEPYPEGWWQQVAQKLELTGDQKAALKLCWTRVKANKASLTAEHEKLLSRLNQLRQQQHNSHKQFGEIAQAVITEQMPHSVDQLRQRQQQLRTQLQQLGEKQQRRQQQKQALRQQQQQQQVLSPRFSCDEQYMELEYELQEVERLLFRDLEQVDVTQKPEEMLQDIQQWLFEDNLDPQEDLNPHSVNTKPSDTLNPDLGTDLHPDLDHDPLEFLSQNLGSPEIRPNPRPAVPLGQNPNDLIQQQQQQGLGQRSDQDLDASLTGWIQENQQQQQQGFVQGYDQAGSGAVASGFSDLMGGGGGSGLSQGFIAQQQQQQQQQQQGFGQGYDQAGSGGGVSGFSDLMNDRGAAELIQTHNAQQQQDMKPCVGFSDPVGFSDTVGLNDCLCFIDQGAMQTAGSCPAVFDDAHLMPQQQQQQGSATQAQQGFMQQQQQQSEVWRSAFSAMAQQQPQQQQQRSFVGSAAAAAAQPERQRRSLAVMQPPSSVTQQHQQQQQQLLPSYSAIKQNPYTPSVPTPAAAAPIQIKGSSKKGRSIPAPITTAAATAAAAAAGSSSTVSASAPAAYKQLLLSAIDADECASLTTVKTAIIEEGEMLLQISSQEHQDIEQHLDVIKDRVKMQHFCQLLAFHNTFTKKQLAAFYVVSYPYLPDALSICEALDELGW